MKGAIVTVLTSTSAETYYDVVPQTVRWTGTELSFVYQGSDDYVTVVYPPSIVESFSFHKP